MTMPGINDAFKKHCAKGLEADSSLSVWKPKQGTSEQPDETPSRFVPLSHSDSSESAFFQITKKLTPAPVSSSPVWDDRTENPAFGGEPFEPSSDSEPPFYFMPTLSPAACATNFKTYRRCGALTSP